MLMVSFDSRNRDWTNDPEKNLRFLKDLERRCNDIFKKKGYFFLTDVFHELGMKDPWEEKTYGWWFELADLPWSVENYISFGLYDSNSRMNRNFINGISPNVALKFNCTGNLGAYLLDRATKYGGFEGPQDIFDYPWEYYDKFEWGDYL